LLTRTEALTHPAPVGVNDLRQYPEALMYAAAAQLRRGRALTSSQHLAEAIRRLPVGHRRTSVAKYMLGWVQWQMGMTVESKQSWEAAKNDFNAILAWDQEFTKQVEQDASVERLLHWQEPYFWLNQWKQTTLDQEALQLKNILDRKVRRRDPTMYQLVDRLVEIGRKGIDYEREAEILLECGLAVYELENFPQALGYLQDAVNVYHPRTHRQAVARWILGVVQWNVESDRNNAALNWEMSITVFEELSLTEDHQGNPKRSKWYEEKLPLMRAALARQLEILYPEP
jgi:tetratricopeptide (TPR) repeat protein